LLALENEMLCVWLVVRYSLFTACLGLCELCINAGVLRGRFGFYHGMMGSMFALGSDDCINTEGIVAKYLKNECSFIKYGIY